MAAACGSCRAGSRLAAASRAASHCRCARGSACPKRPGRTAPSTGTARGRRERNVSDTANSAAPPRIKPAAGCLTSVKPTPISASAANAGRYPTEPLRQGCPPQVIPRAAPSATRKPASPAPVSDPAETGEAAQRVAEIADHENADRRDVRRSRPSRRERVEQEAADPDHKRPAAPAGIQLVRDRGCRRGQSRGGARSSAPAIAAIRNATLLIAFSGSAQKAGFSPRSQ